MAHGRTVGARSAGEPRRERGGGRNKGREGRERERGRKEGRKGGREEREEGRKGGERWRMDALSAHKALEGDGAPLAVGEEVGVAPPGQPVQRPLVVPPPARLRGGTVCWYSV
jgi:hypothetical protein